MPIKKIASGVSIRIHAQPNAKRTEIVGLHGQALKMRVHAPPEDGRANDEIVAYLAKILSLAKSHITLTSGQASRAKTIAIHAATAREADRIEQVLRSFVGKG